MDTQIKNKDPQKLAEEIIEKCDTITEYSIAPKGKFFRSHSHTDDCYGNCKLYIKFVYNDQSKIYRVEHRDLLRAVSYLDKNGWIEVSENIDIPESDRCSKCSGKGYIPGYAHVMNGVCFKCGGTGV